MNKEQRVRPTLECVRALHAAIAPLQDQQKWLIRLMGGIVVGALLEDLLIQ